jgi:hypothetical protein
MLARNLAALEASADESIHAASKIGRRQARALDEERKLIAEAANAAARARAQNAGLEQLARREVQRFEQRQGTSKTPVVQTLKPPKGAFGHVSTWNGGTPTLASARGTRQRHRPWRGQPPTTPTQRSKGEDSGGNLVPTTYEARAPVTFRGAHQFLEMVDSQTASRLHGQVYHERSPLVPCSAMGGLAASRWAPGILAAHDAASNQRQGVEDDVDAIERLRQHACTATIDKLTRRRRKTVPASWSGCNDNERSYRGDSLPSSGSGVENEGPAAQGKAGDGCDAEPSGALMFHEAQYATVCLFVRSPAGKAASVDATPQRTPTPAQARALSPPPPQHQRQHQHGDRERTAPQQHHVSRPTSARPASPASIVIPRSPSRSHVERPISPSPQPPLHPHTLELYLAPHPPTIRRPRPASARSFRPISPTVHSKDGTWRQRSTSPLPPKRMSPRARVSMLVAQIAF